jgi:hypothetical protein
MAVQVYVRPKKATGMFRCVYFYDDIVQQYQLATMRINKANSITNSHLQHINRALEEQTSKVVRFIEETQDVQMDGLSLDFVVDKVTPLFSLLLPLLSLYLCK